MLFTGPSRLTFEMRRHQCSARMMNRYSPSWKSKKDSTSGAKTSAVWSERWREMENDNCPSYSHWRGQLSHFRTRLRVHQPCCECQFPSVDVFFLADISFLHHSAILASHSFDVIPTYKQFWRKDTLPIRNTTMSLRGKDVNETVSVS